MMQKGNTYTYTVTTGKRCYAAVFQRRYFLKVLEIDHESVGAVVSSVDYVPSGYTRGDSESSFGVHVFEYQNLDDVNDTVLELWRMIIGKFDPDFLEHVG